MEDAEISSWDFTIFNPNVEDNCPGHRHILTTALLYLIVTYDVKTAVKMPTQLNTEKIIINLSYLTWAGKNHTSHIFKNDIRV